MKKNTLFFEVGTSKTSHFFDLPFCFTHILPYFVQILKTNFRLEIWWSGTHRVEVYLPSDYAHEMCGVCGDFNYDPSNDLILGPKCVGDGEPGSQVELNGNLCCYLSLCRMNTSIQFNRTQYHRSQSRSRSRPLSV